MRSVQRRVLAAVLAFAAVFAPCVSAYAEPAAQTEEPAPVNPAAGTEDMTFEEALQASYDTLPETNSLPGWPQGPQVYGNAAVVMDMDSGAVLYGKKIYDRHYPASITKLLTALVALENGGMDGEVTFSQESIDILRWDYASIGMKPGEVLSMEDAMYGMLLASGNEVAYAIAENVGNKMGGGYDAFIREMNERSEELGCTGSNWVNANGLHDPQHYTTAYDMALIVSELYKHEEFCTVSQTLNYTIGPTNLTDEPRYVQQKHKMLWPENSNYYEYCTGGKTGYTDDSRTTLVTTAENGTLRLVAVVLRNNRDVYQDTRSILDYVFRNFSRVLLKEQEKPEEVRSYTDDNAYVLLPSGIDFSSLDHQITVTDEVEASGRITFYYEGQNVGSTDVTLTPEYVEEATGYTTRMELSEKPDAGGAEKDEDGGDRMQIPVGLACVAAAVLAVAAVLCVLVLRARYIRAKRRREARRRRRRKQPPRRCSQKR